MALSTRALEQNGRRRPTGRRKSHSRWRPSYRPVPCDDFLFFVFLAEALKKNTVCPVVKKRSHPNLELWVSIRTVLNMEGINIKLTPSSPKRYILLKYKKATLLLADVILLNDSIDLGINKNFYHSPYYECGNSWKKLLAGCLQVASRLLAFCVIFY